MLPPGTIEFLPTVRRIAYGADSLARLPAELDAAGINRALLLLTAGLKRTPLGDAVVEAAQDHTSMTATLPFEHVPPAVVISAVKLYRRGGCDGVVAIGGGSTIDTAKAARFALARDVSDPGELIEAMRAGTRADRPAPPQLSLPTSLAGAECTRSCSTTVLPDGEAPGDKVSVTDSAIASTGIVYSPELAAETPRRLWLASGIAALAHAVEVFCSQPRHPIGDLLKIDAARTLLAWLPDSRSGVALDVHTRLQLAGWAVDHSPLRTEVEGAAAPALVSHALAYDLAAVAGLPYGAAACITLPRSLRWSADHDAASRLRQDELATALGWEGGGLADGVERFVTDLGLPTASAAAGLTPTQCDAVAARAAHRGIAEALSPADVRTILG